MKHIERFLEEKQVPGFSDKKKKLVSIIESITGIVVTTQHISFNGQKIFIKIPPKEKTQILIHKTQILKSCSLISTLSFYREIQ